MYNVELQWKEFNVSLPDVKQWIDANIASAECAGLSANSRLEVHFFEEPSQEDKDALQAYWGAITEESLEAENYQSLEDIEADRATKAASGRAKLAALGLTEEEIDALLG